MAPPSPWTAPLKAFLNAAPAIFSNQGNQHQQAYNALPNQQQPLYHPSASSQPPSMHCNQPTAYSPNAPECKPHASSHLRSSFLKLGRYTKIITLISTSISTLLSLFMEGCMIYMTYTFYKTKSSTPNDQYYDQSGPWSESTKLWPTYLLLGASGITSLLSVGMLVVTCCKSSKKRLFSILYNSIHVLLWAAVTVFYRVGKTGDDLWGWSCDQQGGALQDAFKGVLDFEGLCKIQTSSWQTSIAETGVKVIFSGVGWYLSKRQSNVRKRIVEQIGDSAWDQIDLDF